MTTIMEGDVTSDTDILPVVCWHGINDDARSCDMIFATLNSSTETLSIQVRHNHHHHYHDSDHQVGDTLEADKYNSIFMGMMDQVSIIIIIIMTVTDFHNHESILPRFITAVMSSGRMPGCGLVITPWVCPRAGCC